MHIRNIASLAIIVFVCISCQKEINHQPRSGDSTPGAFAKGGGSKPFKRQIIKGTNSYNEYWTGNLPIILSAPHGGSLKPAALPDRTCAECVTSADLNTRELLRLVDSVFTAKTGCFVHSVFTNLHRVKIDQNRSLPEATDGNDVTLPYYNEYHNNLVAAQNAVMKKYSKGMVIDLHGHGHSIQRLELGYLISGSELRMSDASLLTLAGTSSIRRLNQVALSSPGFVNLVRGQEALGTLLGNKGFPAVPSQQIPYPLEGEAYFSGGYITETYGSLNNLKTDAIQIECNFTNVRDTDANRIAFAVALTDALIGYCSLYFSDSLATLCKL